jgi:hypothetical protein
MSDGEMCTIGEASDKVRGYEIPTCFPALGYGIGVEQHKYG